MAIVNTLHPFATDELIAVTESGCDPSWTEIWPVVVAAVALKSETLTLEYPETVTA
jgi:hypothetical protein